MNSLKCMCMWGVGVSVWRCPQKTEKSVGFLRDEFMGNCEPYDMETEDQTQVHYKNRTF